MEKLADIGLIGLAVIGENLVLNMESKGYTVAVFNRTVEKVDRFVNGRGSGKNLIGTHSIEEFVKSGLKHLVLYNITYTSDIKKVKSSFAGLKKVLEYFK